VWVGMYECIYRCVLNLNTAELFASAVKRSRRRVHVLCSSSSSSSYVVIVVRVLVLVVAEEKRRTVPVVPLFL